MTYPPGSTLTLKSGKVATVLAPPGGSQCPGLVFVAMPDGSRRWLSKFAIAEVLSDTGDREFTV